MAKRKKARNWIVFARIPEGSPEVYRHLALISVPQHLQVRGSPVGVYVVGKSKDLPPKEAKHFILSQASLYALDQIQYWGKVHKELVKAANKISPKHRHVVNPKDHQVMVDGNRFR